MDKSRLRRIESEMQTEIARLLQAEVKDPRLRALTVTGVSVSPDLSHAKVYVVGHDEAESTAVMSALKAVSSLLRYRLAHIIKIRKMPLLHFYYDLSLRESAKINRLLEEVAQKMKPTDGES